MVNPLTRFWRNVPDSQPAPQESNVIPHPRAPTLPEQANKIIEARNALICTGIEIDRQQMAYRSKWDELTTSYREQYAALVREQTVMKELLKNLDGKLEFHNPFPLPEDDKTDEPEPRKDTRPVS